MRASRKLIVTMAMFLSLILVGGAVNFALASTGQIPGYVQYKITVNGPENSNLPSTLFINESAQPTGQTGFVDITLFVSSSTANLTYSKDVNSSSLPEIFPYLSGLTNQSFSYDVQGFSINANLVNTGQVPVTYNDTAYQATRYLVSFSALNSSNAESFLANGSITSMPSGLIDSVQLTLNQTTSVEVALLSTNLSLTDSASINVIGASMFVAAIAAALIVVGLTINRKMKHNNQNSQTKADESESKTKSDAKQENGSKEKPSYWVD